MAARQWLLQPAHDVCGPRLVYPELQQVHRRAPRALRWRRVPDAGRYLGHAQPQARERVLNVLADAAGGRAHAHEAVQACLGHGRLGICRAPSAIREGLCGCGFHHPQPLLSRNRLGRVQSAGRGLYGELRLSEDGGRRRDDGRDGRPAPTPIRWLISRAFGRSVCDAPMQYRRSLITKEPPAAVRGPNGLAALTWMAGSWRKRDRYTVY